MLATIVIILAVGEQMAALELSRVHLSLDCALLSERVNLYSGMSPGLERADPDSSSSSFSDGCVTLGKSLSLSGLQFSHLSSEGVGPKDLLSLIGL